MNTKNLKLFCIDLVHDITIEIHLPLIFCLFIELCSNLQILSLSLLPLLENIPTSRNKLSAALNHILSYSEPFKIFNPFGSEASVITILTLCSLYFVLYLAMVGYITYQKGEKNQIKEALMKIASFITLIHGKIIFYFIHCFVMKALSNKEDFCDSPGSMTCTAERIIIPAILFVFNIAITLCQEVFCYQIHQNKFAYGIKNNLHNFVKFAHKFLIVILFCLFEDSAKILILFSVTLTLIDLYLLHSRLPFFNLKMLQLSITCSTISAFFAIVTVYRFFAKGENLCLSMIPITPLIVKMSIMKLNQTLRNIFSFKVKTPYHAVHLPNLIEDYLQKHAILPLPDKINKTTLYSMGFLGQEIERILVTTNREQNLQMTTQEIRKAAFVKAIEFMSRILQRYPQSEILLLSVAQIYAQVFEDSFKALDIVNKISDKNKSFPGSVSINVISDDLAAMHQDMGQFGAQQEKRKISHLGYFAYQHKVQTLQKYIKLEIQDHLHIWKNFSSTELDIFQAINQASQISAHSRKVTNYWYKNFEGHELLYVNATLMYGLYLEIIQAIPRGGSSFMKKAYNAINNKWHLLRDIIDVTVGTSAVIVASIEPDKIGKVVDASSSVKHLFKTTKQGLIGTNIGVILPNFVAMRHNDLIRGYQKYFTGNIDHNINSYAKTLQDEYFKAEVTLHVSPLTHKGLNLVSFVKKVSEYQSLMIVDHRGNIVEYSKDLSTPLNLFMKKSHIKIESLCPDFKKINQAFAVLYQNPNNNDDAFTAKNNDQSGLDDTFFMQSPQLKTPLTRNTNNGYLESILPPMSPTNQRLLSNSVMENDPVAFKSFRSEIPLSSNNDETPMIIHKNTTETLGTNAYGNNNIPMISQEEAQEIWETYKDAKELTFFPYNKKGSQRVAAQEVRYKAEIEPYFFANKWYKIIKMKAPSSHHHDKSISHEMMPRVNTIEGPVTAVFSIIDDFADDFPSAEERTDAEVMTDSRKRSWTKTHLALKTVKYVKTQQTMSLAKNTDSNTFENNSNKNGQNAFKVASEKAQSVVSSQASQKMTAKRLGESFKLERHSTSSKLVVTMVYISIIAIICSVCVHLIYSKNSLDEMQSSIRLVRTVNMRLAKTILNWQAMMVLYSRSAKLRPIDYKIPMYQAVTINASLAVLENAKQLAEEADQLANKDLVSALYVKTVSFWEPLKHTLFDGRPVDQFTGNQVLIDYYLWVARYKGSYLDLFNNREFLFAINNTGNDYLLTLDKSIDVLAEFFDDMKSKNVGLITGITTMEILFVLSPLALILIIFFIVIRTYSKLFQAICRINDQSLSKRVKQLEELSVLFEENLEDDVSCFQKFKGQGLTIQHFSKKSASTTSFRRFKIQGLAIHLFKYVLFAAVLIMIIIAFVVVALQKSISNFQNLATINKKVMTVYSVGAPIRSLQSAFYISMIFYNDTSFKIRHDNPANQVRSYIDTLDDATSILLSVLSDENNDISDPVVKDILDGNVCQYVTAEYQLNCIQDTKGSQFGLLGLHTIYSQVAQTMRDWINAKNPTFTLGVSLSAQFSKLHNNVHFVLYDVYDYLSNYLVETFIEAADENKVEIQEMFYRNLSAVLVAMILIRTTVLTRLQVFDLGIRRILRIIPYKIIEENKVMSCYLARTFQNELKVMKQIG